MGLFSKIFGKNKKTKQDKIVDSKIDIGRFIGKNNDNVHDAKEENEFIDLILSLYSDFESFINQDKYISRKDYSKFVANKEEQLKFVKQLDEKGMLKSQCTISSYDEIKMKIQKLSDPFELIDKHNDDFVSQKKLTEKKYLDDILKACDTNIVLDYDQRTCVLTDEDYCLVIAGAGAGKTTTVAAKVKYLVDKQNVNPKDILVVSFTNKAVGELKERINTQLGIQCPITTFHATGIAIIKKDSPDAHINPVNEGFMYNAVRDFLQDGISNNKTLLDKMILLFGSYFESPFKEGDLKSYFTYLIRSDFSTLKSNIGDYNKQIIDNRTKKYTTIQDERVKSYQEVQIANFLYTHGLDYEYEPTYPAFMPGSDKYYTPDFLIIQNGKKVYLEHFALSQDLKNSRFSEEDISRYVKSIKDKTNLHKKYNTKLITTWSKYNDGLSLTDHLSEELAKAGFIFEQKTSEEIFQRLNKSEKNKYFAPMIKLICTFISNYKVNGYNEKHFAIMKDNVKNVRTKLFLEIAEGAYLFYEQRLHLANYVDFSDMINESARLLEEKERLHELLSFKYIIVDEYQDISRQRFDLTKALSKVCDAKIIAVGDDWQSIYAFSGSDLSLFTKFKDKMGYAKELKIIKTYRNAQEVIDIAGGFVQENISQIRKKLISPKHIEKPIIILSYKDEYQELKEQGFKNDTESRSKMVEDAITQVVAYNKSEGKTDKSSILLIGRYNFDGAKLGNTKYFDYNEKTGEIKSKKYPNISLSFMTAHSSKGLGYDNVIIINAIDTMYGFPAQLDLDPVLQLVIHDDKNIDYAEERRLFYVALTRTKNRVFIVAPETRPSKFILELKENYSNVVLEGELNPATKLTNLKLCPVCGYPLQLRFNENYGLKLYMCTNEPELCDFMTNDIHGGKMSICKCDKCTDGFLIVRHSTKTGEYFLGCTNYYSQIKCGRQMSKQEYYENNGIDDSTFDLSKLYNKTVSGVKPEDYQVIEEKEVSDIVKDKKDSNLQEVQEPNIKVAPTSFESSTLNIQRIDGNKNTIKPEKTETKEDNYPNYKKNTKTESLINQEDFQKFYDDLLEIREKFNGGYKELFYVLPETVIFELYISQPLDESDLPLINGLGEIRIEKMGEEIIRICNNYISLKNIDKAPIVRNEDEKKSIGQKWTSDEEKQLTDEFSQGMTISEIAKIHGRTNGGIRSRLRKMELID